MLPEWMAGGEVGALCAGKAARRRSPLTRALGSLSGLLGLETAASDASTRSGWLQRVDPRAKLLALASLLFAATAVQRPSTLAGILAASLLAAASTRLPLRAMAAILATAMGFSLAVVLPASLSAVTPGRPLVILVHAPHAIAVTMPGMVIAVRFILRTGACVALAMLLTFSTPWAQLLGSLRSVGLPRPFILLLGMARNYLFVLARLASEMHLARRSRSLSEERGFSVARWVSWRIGALFGISRRLGEEVALAMAARGFAGSIALPEMPPLGRSLWIGLLGAAIAIALVALDRMGR